MSRCKNCKYLGDIFRGKFRKCNRVLEGEIPIESVDKDIYCRHFSKKDKKNDGK